MHDATFLNDYRRCPQYAWRRHEQGWTLPREGVGPLEAGQLIHEKLAQYYRGEVVSWAPQKVTEALRDDTTMYPVAYLERVVAEYMRTYPTLPKVLRVEQYLEAALPNGVEWCGIVDVDVEYEDGCVYTMDHKTTSWYINEAFFDKLRMSTQMVGYGALHLAMGWRWDGYIIDAIKLDKQRYNITPKDFQQHGPVRVAQWRLDEWARHVEGDLKAAERGEWPMWEQGCFAWNKPCQFWRVCTLPPQLREAELEAHFVHEPWEPHRRGS